MDGWMLTYQLHRKTLVWSLRCLTNHAKSNHHRHKLAMAQPRSASGNSQYYSGLHPWTVVLSFLGKENYHMRSVENIIIPVRYKDTLFSPLQTSSESVFIVLFQHFTMFNRYGFCNWFPFKLGPFLFVDFSPPGTCLFNCWLGISDYLWLSCPGRDVMLIRGQFFWVRKELVSRQPVMLHHCLLMHVLRDRLCQWMLVHYISGGLSCF